MAEGAAGEDEEAGDVEHYETRRDGKMEGTRCIAANVRGTN